MKKLGILTLNKLLVYTFVLCSLSCRYSVDPEAVANSNVAKARIGEGPVTNSEPFPPYTVRVTFTRYQARAVKTGGSEGLVNNTVSANQVFSEMASGTDRATYTPFTSTTPGRITDQDGNSWTLYVPSTASQQEFQAKGYSVVRSID